MFDITQNFWFKIIGISLILYFALFHDKQNPQSLGHKLEKENIKKNYNEAKEKTQEIIKNVLIAKEFSRKKELSNNGKTLDNEDGKIIVINEFRSNNKKTISCNDQVDIELEVKNINNSILQPKSNLSFIFGDNSLPIIEEFSTNMTISSSKIINIPQAYKSDSKILHNLRQQGHNDVIYHFTIKKITPTQNNFICK